MWLTTEELSDITDIKVEVLIQIFEDEGFGNFAVLSASETEFIQAASDWSPTKECEAFIEQHQSDPWILEYHDKGCRQPLRADGLFTLAQVKEAFVSYLQGNSEWRTGRVWVEIKG